MAENQRENSRSNAHVGREFERIAQEYLEGLFSIKLARNSSLEIGLAELKKPHKFDLVNDSFLVECKSHRWTKGGHVPSAKLTVWNEAMFFFHLAPTSKYRKIFFVERHFSDSKEKTLATYYLERYEAYVPKEVEIWEFDIEKGSHVVLNPLKSKLGV